MNIGDIIVEKRKALNLSQEQLAEQINVSRSAVAKWETNKGFPDIENLKALSKKLDISIDHLLNASEKDNKVQDSNEVIFSWRDEKIQNFISKKCTVELANWNDGIFDGYIINQDENFIYYLIPEKKRLTVGILSKILVTEIRLSNAKDKYQVDLMEYGDISREYFVGKKINVYLNEKHIWNGIIGKKTEFLDVVAVSFSNDHLVIEENTLITDTVIQIEEISKVEFVAVII